MVYAVAAPLPTFRQRSAQPRLYPAQLEERMTAYRTIVVGTDGSDSSYVAVDKAAALAGAAGATLSLPCAYYPTDDRDVAAASDMLKDEAYQVRGSAPTNEILRTARDRAVAAGAKEIVEKAIVGEPVESLLDL